MITCLLASLQHATAAPAISFDRVACCKTHLTAVATARLDQESDGRPMYLQIMEQIKQKVAVEEWTPGYEISSIRTMAVALRVSVNTVNPRRALSSSHLWQAPQL